MKDLTLDKTKKDYIIENKNNKKPYIILSTVILLMCLGLATINFLLSPKEIASKAFVSFDVSAGSTTNDLANKLQEKGLIKSSKAFEIYARLNGFDKQVKSGIYSLSPSMSPKEILQKMIKGDVVRNEVKVTIPEGYTIKQMAATFEKHNLINAKSFIEAAKADNYRDKYQFLQSVPNGASLEGFLFPDTYYFSKTKPISYYINVFLKRFQDIYDKNDIADKQKRLEYSTYEIITLASIIEGEAKLDKEKPIIAGVFYNRLQKGMPLQSCATVEYILDEHKEVLTFKDIEIDSPYNTYLYKGLPPGPINSPGLSSILAALEPADVDYYYFVSNGDGSHSFSKTFEEHQQKKMKLK